MKTKFLLRTVIGFGLCSIDLASAQVQQAWVARYPGLSNSSASATALAVDGAGTVYVTGSLSSTNGTSAFLTLKYDADGRQLWAAAYNGPSNLVDSASALAIDGAGNVYVTGISDRSSGGSDGVIATIKYDASGRQLWAARHQSPVGTVKSPSALAVESGGNVYVSSSVILPPVGDYPSGDYLTIKYDPSGNELWSVRYDGPGRVLDQANAMVVDGAGNVYVTGGSFSRCGGIAKFGIRCFSDYATVKYDSNGQLLWVARYNAGEPSYSSARAITVDSAGHVYVTGFSSFDFCGYTRSDIPVFCPDDYATVAYDENGNQLWVARYNGPGDDEDDATAIAVDKVGSVFVTGWSTFPILDLDGTYYDGKDFVTIKYDSQGNELWRARYGEPSHLNEPSAVALDAAGNVYVTGYSYGGTYMTPGHSDRDYATVKYDPNGNQLWVARYNGPGNGKDTPTGLGLDNSGNVYVAGGSDGGIKDDFATIKYSQTNLPGLPMVAAEPQNRSITEGGSVTFSAVASGAEPLTYQWRLNGTNIPGATNLTLSLSYIQTVQAGEYSVAASNAVGVTVSATARLEVPPLLQLAWLAIYGAEVDPVDSVNAMAVDNAGNVYVTGYVATQANGDADYATVKYDTRGNKLWAVRHNGTGNGNDSATAIAVDPLGNVYVTGFSIGIGTGYDYATVKYGPQGNQLWVRRYNSSGSRNDRPAFKGLALDNAGNIYVTGSAGTLKYDGNGTQRWITTNLVGDALVVDGTGHIYVTGSTDPPGRATAKYDKNGNQLWLSRSTNYSYASGVALDPFGNVYVTGDSTLVKYDPDGNELWSARYDRSVPNFLEAWNGAAVDSAGNVYVAGYGRGILTLKYAADGHLLWAGAYQGPAQSEDAPYAVAVDAAGNVYVTGYVTVYTPHSIGLNFDIAILKYDSVGHQLAAERLGSRFSDEQAYALALDAAANVYVAGFSFGSGFVTAKYVQHPIPTQLTMVTLFTNGQIQFTLSGEAQRSYDIQASTDLRHWASATNLFNGAGTVDFQNVATGPRRFYRAMKR